MLPPLPFPLSLAHHYSLLLSLLAPSFFLLSLSSAARRVRKAPTKLGDEDEKEEEDEKEGGGGVGEDSEVKVENEAKKPAKRAGPVVQPPRGKGGRFVHKDPAVAALSQNSSPKVLFKKKDGNDGEEKAEGEDKDKSMEANTSTEAKDENEGGNTEGTDAVQMDMDTGGSTGTKMGDQAQTEKKEQETMGGKEHIEDSSSLRLASLRRDSDLKMLRVNRSTYKNESEKEAEREGEREGEGEEEEEEKEEKEREAERIQEIKQEGESAKETSDMERDQEHEGVSEEREQDQEREDDEVERERQLEQEENTSYGSMENNSSSAQTDPTTKPGGPAEVGPKRSTRVREKGERIKLREAEEAAREKEKEEEKKAKAKRKEAKKKENEAKDGEAGEKKRKEKKRKKDEEQPEGAEKKKKTEKKKKKDLGEGEGNHVAVKP
jgi:hypothetical protein